MGSVPNSRLEISTRYGIRWFKCKLKPPNNESCQGIQLEDFLNSPQLQLLTKIINELQIHGKSKDWRTYTEDDIFSHILMYKDKLLNFPIHDMNLIVKVIEGNTAWKIFASKDMKDTRAAKIFFLFGSGQLIYNFEDNCPQLCRTIPIVNPSISLCRCYPH